MGHCIVVAQKLWLYLLYLQPSFFSPFSHLTFFFSFLPDSPLTFRLSFRASRFSLLASRPSFCSYCSSCRASNFTPTLVDRLLFSTAASTSHRIYTDTDTDRRHWRSARPISADRPIVPAVSHARLDAIVSGPPSSRHATHSSVLSLVDAAMVFTFPPQS